jgi:hypothetical protein
VTLEEEKEFAAAIHERDALEKENWRRLDAGEPPVPGGGKRWRELTDRITELQRKYGLE